MRAVIRSILFHVLAAVAVFLIGSLLAGLVVSSYWRIVLIVILPSLALAFVFYGLTRKWPWAVFFFVAPSVLCLRVAYESFDGEWMASYGGFCLVIYALSYFISTVSCSIFGFLK